MAWNRDQSNMELGQWYGITVGYVPYLVRLQLLLDYLHLGVNGFLLLLCLLHPTQTSNKGLVGPLKLVCLVLCLI